MPKHGQQLLASDSTPIGHCFHAPADGTCYWHCMNVAHYSDQEEKGCADGYALREKFCAWLEDDLDTRTEEVLACHNNNCQTFLYDDIHALLLAEQIEQSIFSEDIDKCYVEALRDYRYEDIGTFLAAERAVTRCALQQLCEKYRNPKTADGVCYYMYPESFTFGATFWTRHVPRYEMRFDKGKREWFAEENRMQHASHETRSAWALLLVNLERDGEHYDLIKLASDT